MRKVLAVALSFCVLSPALAAELKGRPLPYEPVHQSDRVGPESRAFTTTEELEAWRDLFSAGQAPAVKVDFERELVIVAALGAQSSSGHTVKITRVFGETSGKGD